MGNSAVQLTLGVRLRDDATLENFHFLPALGPLLSLLEHQLQADGEPAIYLYGPAGCGRSHLLQAACHQQPAGSALYLALEQFVNLPAAEVLADVERMALICLDDLDAVAGDAAWELALFHLCNRARESGARLLFSASDAPRNLRVQLPDLRSRLSWGVIMQLPEPGDEDKLDILRFRASRRGLQLSREVAAFILARAPRSLTDLMAVLDQLDRESLVHQRQLSIPFVKQCMDW
ncbi:MAG: DnaA regulatory inactivator Hda [Gammaproteobacteria bacterium]|nr:DnaA regulatory inactivator Hda [Gammaproteobacteria bacterium]